jgi:hypothetical protein
MKPRTFFINKTSAVAAWRSARCSAPWVLLPQTTSKQGQSFTQTAPQALSLSPYIYVTKTDGEQLLTGTALLVETKPGEKGNWIGKYMYQTDLKLAKADLADGLSDAEPASLEQALTEGVEQLMQIFLTERRGSMQTEQAITFISDFVSPRFKIEMVGDKLSSGADRVNIRTVGAIYSLPRKGVEVKSKGKAKKKADTKKSVT